MLPAGTDFPYVKGSPTHHADSFHCTAARLYDFALALALGMNTMYSNNHMTMISTCSDRG
ncbi:hypothetical protein C1192_23900 (plasmid) [Escherichia marmotae]|nr:hypothetical protein C1192_23900 [Escherichia marmotae]